jgi:hypothetical protein
LDEKMAAKEAKPSPIGHNQRQCLTLVLVGGKILFLLCDWGIFWRQMLKIMLLYWLLFEWIKQIGF